MEKLAEMLTKIQKALGEYLERQRSAFPRFYFVGDEDLLEIIGNSKDLYLSYDFVCFLFLVLFCLYHILCDQMKC